VNLSVIRFSFLRLLLLLLLLLLLCYSLVLCRRKRSKLFFAERFDLWEHIILGKKEMWNTIQCHISVIFSNQSNSIMSNRALFHIRYGLPIIHRTTKLITSEMSWKWKKKYKEWRRGLFIHYVTHLCDCWPWPWTVQADWIDNDSESKQKLVGIVYQEFLYSRLLYVLIKFRKPTAFDGIPYFYQNYIIYHFFFQF
jgi:hypothetical protein